MNFGSKAGVRRYRMLLELWFEQQTKTVKALKLRKLCLLMSEHERKISFLVLRKKWRSRCYFYSRRICIMGKANSHTGGSSIYIVQE